MKREFLEGLGLEKEAVDKIMAENGADLEREKAKTTAAKADLADAQGKLSAAQTELEGLKKAGGDIGKLQQQLTDLQVKYDTDTKALRGQLDDRDYSDAINGFIAEKGLKFSSKSAERAFITAFKEKKLERKDGAFVGADDFLKAQQEADPAAFSNEGGSVKVSMGGPLGGGKGPMSKEEIFKIKDPTDRQNAIAENIGIFRKDE